MPAKNVQPMTLGIGGETKVMTAYTSEWGRWSQPVECKVDWCSSGDLKTALTVRPRN